MCTFVPKQCGGGGALASCALCSAKFKTLVSFPEAAAFAWLDRADLGLSRRPRPSPPDGSSASHATCSARGAAPRRAARVPGETTHGPGGSAQRRAARMTRNRTEPELLLAGVVLFLFFKLLLTPWLYLCGRLRRVAVKDSICQLRISEHRPSSLWLNAIYL